jgi:arabinofuranan 3-O-arabinosyltransferase
VRWRERSYFILLVFVGMVLSVGPFPYTHPTAVGGVLKAFMTDTTAGLALRSTDRATPVVLLGLAMLLGSGVTALWRRSSLVGLTTALLIGALVVANNPSLFNGDTIANNFTQPASLPSYQMQAIHHLNATHPGTRVLAIPGNDFASYRWGDTVDTPQPAYLTATSSPGSSRSWAPSPRPTRSTPWTTRSRRTWPTSTRWRPWPAC